MMDLVPALVAAPRFMGRMGERSGWARPLDEGGHSFDVLRLPGVAFLLQRSHGFLVPFLHGRHGFFVTPRMLLRPYPALRPHEQQPAGDHQRLQHPATICPIPTRIAERLTSSSASCKARADSWTVKADCCTASVASCMASAAV